MQSGGFAAEKSSQQGGPQQAGEMAQTSMAGEISLISALETAD